MDDREGIVRPETISPDRQVLVMTSVGDLICKVKDLQRIAQTIANGDEIITDLKLI